MLTALQTLHLVANSLTGPLPMVREGLNGLSRRGRDGQQICCRLGRSRVHAQLVCSGGSRQLQLSGCFWKAVAAA